MKCRKCGSEMTNELLGGFTILHVCLKCNPLIAEFRARQTDKNKSDAI